MGQVLPGAVGGVIDGVVARLAAAERLLVATDFDGVLAPIVADPADVRAEPGSMAALRRLADQASTTVAVVSGRSFEQLGRLVAPVGDFVLIGSHGAELGSELSSDADRAEIDRLLASLEGLVNRHPGLHIEAKTVSVAVHFRRLEDRRPDAVAEAEAAVNELTEGWPGKIVTGKEVVEFTLGRATKGDAVLALADRLKATNTVYFGDDVTDEDVFAVLGPDDVGIKVGPGETLAGHRLESVAEVHLALTALADARTA